MVKTKILGTGHYLPKKLLTNTDLEKIVDTNNDWIVERTGIRERHLAADDECTSDLALHASRKALEQSGVSAKDLDMILVATCTPDYYLPNTACELQRKLEASTCVAWDLNAACSGFLYGLSVANQYIRTGSYKKILLVGTEALTRLFVNYKDRETCILFGDGAGAVVLGPSSDASEILGEVLTSDGGIADQLMVRGGGTKLPLTEEVLKAQTHTMVMKGRELFKSAVRTMGRCSQQVLEQAGKSLDDVTWVIPHQANLRIIEGVAKQLNMPMDRVIVNLDRTGNTSSASVPIALDEAARAGKVKRGDLILITVFGAGLTSGALLLRY